jgi:hypothetical protein
MVYFLYFLTPTEELNEAMNVFFTIFNPFKGTTKNDVTVLRNMMLITSPMGIIYYYRTYLGIQMWI